MLAICNPKFILKIDWWIIQLCLFGREQVDSELFLSKDSFLPGMVVHTCNPSTWEAEAGGR
jgi:hypothetical protein